MNATQLATAVTNEGSYLGTLDSTPWSLSDCHAAEHLLIGTHDLNGMAEPVCVTCQFDNRR